MNEEPNQRRALEAFRGFIGQAEMPVRLDQPDAIALERRTMLGREANVEDDDRYMAPVIESPQRTDHAV